MMAASNLTSPQVEMLRDLSKTTGADVWDYCDARVGRELEKLGAVRIVKAKNAPKNGAERQPYYGIKISAAGHKMLAATAAAQ